MRCALRAASAGLLGLCFWATLAQAASTARRDPLALERLAQKVAHDLIAAHAEPPVALHVRGESAELSRAFTSVLAAELARLRLPAVAMNADSAAAAESEARSAGARSLVRLSLSIENGRLQARGDLLGTWINFWSGATRTRPAAPAAGLEASVDADAHVLALAAVALSREPAAVSPQSGELRMMGGVFARLPRHSAALAAGDLDGDGKDEVVVLTDEELLAFSPEGRLLGRRDLRPLPLAASPCREPFGAVSIARSPPRITWLSAQRARGETVALDPNGGFQVLGPADRVVVAEAGGVTFSTRLSPGVPTFTPELEQSGGGRLALPRAPTALSGFGGPNGAELLVVYPDTTATWRQGFAPDGPSTELRGLGAASALIDVDGDGAAELVTTEAAWAPAPEVLRVLRAPSLGSPSPDAVRFRKEIPRGRALQVVGADLDGDAADEVILAVWLPDGSTELQVYRRAR
ncbi:MAG: VCBS repeat-containing protein [Myxococcaceae bacterium]|nr:VCBS repeat-containing protein [Myxococcaceae bacterium]